MIYDEVFEQAGNLEPKDDELIFDRFKSQVGSYLSQKLSGEKTRASNGADLQRIPLPQYIEFAYQMLLRRPADEAGLAHFERLISKENLSREGLLDHLVASDEYQNLRSYNNISLALHESRKRFIKSMPPSRCIVDLGGSAQDAKEGAMVLMGYPYKFDKLTIVDLPIAERHEIYQGNDEAVSVVETSLGTVEYQYGSMTDLSMFEDSSVDLVYSGQTIEHVTREDAQLVYQEVLRILKPGAPFYVDTPNSRLTRLQQAAFIDPDHKYEYTHAELKGDITSAGFEMREEKGLNHAGMSVANNQFDLGEIMQNVGVYGDPDVCYLLAYVCVKPID